jgi:hypothetical protein
MHLFQPHFCKGGVNFTIVLPKLAIVKPIEHNERSIEEETSMDVDVLQGRAIRLPNNELYGNFP